MIILQGKHPFLHFYMCKISMHSFSNVLKFLKIGRKPGQLLEQTTNTNLNTKIVSTRIFRNMINITTKTNANLKMWPRHCSSGWSQASHRCGPGSRPGLVKWDLWWTKQRWVLFSPSISDSPTNLHSTKFPIFTITWGKYNKPEVADVPSGLHRSLWELKNSRMCQNVSKKHPLLDQTCNEDIKVLPDWKFNIGYSITRTSRDKITRYQMGENFSNTCTQSWHRLPKEQILCKKFQLRARCIILFELLYKKTSKWIQFVLIWKSWAWKPEHHVLCRTWLQSGIKPRYSSKHCNYVFDSAMTGCLESTRLHCSANHNSSTIYYNET
jgi:hypothetical protein